MAPQIVVCSAILISEGAVIPALLLCSFFQQNVLAGDFAEAFHHLVTAAFGVHYLDASGGIDVYEVGERSRPCGGTKKERGTAGGLVVHPLTTLLLHIAPRGEMPLLLITELLGLTVLGIDGSQQDGPVLQLQLHQPA